MKQWILKEDAEPGIYPGLGLAEAGKPLTAYGEDQEKAFSADKRFKIYHAPKEEAAEPAVSDSDAPAVETAAPDPETADAEPPADAPSKPAQTGKGKVK